MIMVISFLFLVIATAPPLPEPPFDLLRSLDGFCALSGVFIAAAFTDFCVDGEGDDLSALLGAVALVAADAGALFGSACFAGSGAGFVVAAGFAEDETFLADVIGLISGLAVGFVATLGLAVGLTVVLAGALGFTAGLTVALVDALGFAAGLTVALVGALGFAAGLTVVLAGVLGFAAGLTVVLAGALGFIAGFTVVFVGTLCLVADLTVVIGFSVVLGFVSFSDIKNLLLKNILFNQCVPILSYFFMVRQLYYDSIAQI